MNIKVEVTDGELRDMDMKHLYQLEDFIETTLSVTFTVSESEVDVNVMAERSE